MLSHKEYRDTVRRSRNSSPSNIAKQQSRPGEKQVSQYTQPGEPTTQSPSLRPGEKTRMPSMRFQTDRENSPNTIQSMCAWCTENGMPHQHTTSHCHMLKKANAIDQWKVLYKHRVCDRCLTQGHYWRDCSSNNPQCPNCNMFHHQNIACRPLERISQSTYPKEQ